MDTLTVIDGGKSGTAGKAQSKPVPVTQVCKSGLLITFEGTIFERLPGAVAVSAAIFPEHLIMEIISIAMNSDK